MPEIRDMKYCTKRSNTIILVPYPAQGHVTPMLKLASAFLSHGFNPVLVTPDYIHRQIVPNLESKDENILCMPIPDGLERDAARDFFTIEKSMENTMPVHLERLVQQLEEDGGVVVCVVVDLLASWAIEVANRCGVPAAGFWPAMLATYRLIGAVPEMVRAGLISDAGFPKQAGGACLLPDQPMLSSEELPWLIGTPAARNGRFKFWAKTLDRSKSLRWLLVNSFPNEYFTDDKQSHQQQYDHQLVKVTQSQPLVFPIGPLNKFTATKNPSLWEEDTSCLNWLDNQKPNAVVYISFGSWVSPIGVAKVQSLALTLEALGKPFIWVLGPSWREGLPIGYLEKVSKIGKIVSWAPQMEVLKHKAVGCYLTHCGWNSTMEAIQCQKRLLCWPVAGDQFVNCSYIVNLWRVGVRLNGFGEEDVEEGLKRVMEEDEMGHRLQKLYERSMGDEANSRAVVNLTAFIDQLKTLNGALRL